MSFLIKPEGFFVCIGLFMGFIFIVIVPPFQTPDENIHFYRAYEVSELELPHKISTGETGSYLPLSIEQTQSAVHGVYAGPNTSGHIMFNPSEKYDYRYTKSALFDIPLNKKVHTFYNTSGSPAYMPLSYLPQAAVVALARFINAPVIVMLYLTRIINLLTFVVLAYFGIKLFPWKKWALVAICLFPVVVSQTISPGLDAGIFGATLIFVGLIFKTLSNKQFNLQYRHLVILLITSLVMIFGKSVLILFLPLIFLVRKKQIGIRYARFVKPFIALVPVILYLLWSVLSVAAGSSADQSSGSLQTHIFLSNPLVFVSSLINTFIFITPSGDILAQSMVGSFGWLDTPLAPTFVALGYIFLSFILVANYEPVRNSLKITRGIRILLFTISLSYIVAVFLAMYIYFTPVGGNHIRGVSGRYLVPTLFLAVPTLFSNIIRVGEKTYINCVKVVSIFLLLISVLTIVLRYYVTFIPQ